MPFREKSAWIMLVVLSVIALGYFSQIIQWSLQTQEIVSPSMAGVVRFTLALVAWTVVSQIVLAVIWPKDAQRRLDERERHIHEKAENWSGIVLGIGLVTSLGYYLFYLDGNLLFYMAFASLIVSQCSEYVFCIINYRRAF